VIIALLDFIANLKYDSFIYGTINHLKKSYMKNVIVPLLILSILFCACSSKSGKQTRKENKTILIGVTQKPTYPDLITYAIKPLLEKKGYKIELKQLDDQYVFNESLVNGDVDINIGQHELALNFHKSNNPDWNISPLIKVPSAHMGIFSEKYQVSTIEELKKALQKGDVVAMPDDATNLPRSLIFLEHLGFLTIKKDVDKFTATERDIAENYYDLNYKVLTAEQIPRILDNIAVGVIFGDDADLLGIFDKAIVREVNTDDLFLNTFVVQTEDLNAPWVADFVEAVQSEEFKNSVEDAQYRFHKFYRPAWYVEKWGIFNN
jgi:D-methionine transport system substrate-binding protein